MSDDQLNLLRRSLGDPPPPGADLRRRVLSAVAAEARPRQRGRLRRQLVAACLSAAAVLAVSVRWEQSRARRPDVTLTADDEQFVLGADDADDDETALYDVAEWSQTE